jgi:hypothetical protein
MPQKLLIFQKTYELTLWLVALANRFPKWQRPILGTQIYSTVLDALLLIEKANKERSPQVRKEQQGKISTHLDALLILIRLTKDLKLMSVRQYTHACTLLNEIGRMHTAWKRSVG